MNDDDITDESSWWDRTVGYLGDWGFALLLTVLGFWLIGKWQEPNLPAEAPQWTLQDLQGKSVSLTDFKEQTVILNFWATWCSACRTEIPILTSFAQENPSIPVLGIAVDGSAASLRVAKKKLGIDYPVLLGSKSVQQEYKISSLPTTIVVGPDGKIKDVHVGVMLAPQLRWATGTGLLGCAN